MTSTIQAAGQAPQIRDVPQQVPQQVETPSRLDPTAAAVAAAHDVIAQVKPPVGGGRIEPDARGTAIGNGLALLLRLIEGGMRLHETGEMREGLRDGLDRAIGALDSHTQLTGDPGFVEVRALYRPIGSVNHFVGVEVSEVRDLSRRDQHQLRAPLPDGVHVQEFRIHNVPRSDVEGMIGVDRAREDLERLSR